MLGYNYSLICATYAKHVPLCQGAEGGQDYMLTNGCRVYYTGILSAPVHLLTGVDVREPKELYIYIHYQENPLSLMDSILAASGMVVNDYM